MPPPTLATLMILPRPRSTIDGISASVSHSGPTALIWKNADAMVCGGPCV
jgi:hypothetical protein